MQQEGIASIGGSAVVDSNWETSQQIQYGAVAISAILAVTLLIRALTLLVKACRP